MSFRIEVAGRFARQALEEGPGEVVAVFRRSFYVRSATGRLACVGDASLGRGPLNALGQGFSVPSLGERFQASVAGTWTPERRTPFIDFQALKDATLPEDGLACLIAGAHNALAVHAQPALEALSRWLEGNSLAAEAETLIGLGPGLTPSGDDYLGGMMVALRAAGRASQAASLWRWLEPRLAARTSALSGAHLVAAAEGEGHEVLHAVLSGSTEFARLDGVGHTSAWDALAGACAVLKSY